MPLVHRVAIVSEKGEVKGFLRVAVQAISGKFMMLSQTYFEQIPIRNSTDFGKKNRKNRANLQSVQYDFTLIIVTLREVLFDVF